MTVSADARSEADRTRSPGTAADGTVTGRSPWTVFKVFLRLGLTSFGGPIAHLGYFRERLIEREKWLDDKAYADLVALCQFLPGPASSQVAMAIGYKQCGLPGALAAFAGFTLPSLLIMLAAGYGVSTFSDPIAGSIIQGLKIAAVAVVAHAVWSMARNLCPDRLRSGFAVVAAVWMLVLPTAVSQVLVIIIGGIAGHWLIAAEPAKDRPRPRPLSRADHRQVFIGFGLFSVLLLASPLLAAITSSQAVAVFDAFYRSGALVFGGGHVVLPLLEHEVVASGWVTQDDFLAGYGIAQAVPGPLFTFASFLGAVLAEPPTGIAGALLATGAVFLPGFLLVYGGIPLWERIRSDGRLRSALMGTNAAVVGLLLAALYDPVWVNAVHGPEEFALALITFSLLAIWKVPALQVVLIAAGGGLVLAFL